MKTMIKILLLTCLLSFKPSEPMVYVCHSKSSVAYHEYKDCRGLQRCTHEIIYVAKKDAVNKYGKRACKICH
jgi:hypothetical protein